LAAETDIDPQSPAYQSAATEIMRGIRLVSGLDAALAEPGWIAVECGSASKARWLSEQIVQEQVAATYRGTQLWVPVDGRFTVGNEIKSVITVLAKTTHYWSDHLSAEVKNSLAWEEKLKTGWTWLRRLLKLD
jgi:hypothetical protein